MSNESVVRGEEVGEFDDVVSQPRLEHTRRSLGPPRRRPTHTRRRAAPDTDDETTDMDVSYSRPRTSVTEKPEISTPPRRSQPELKRPARKPYKGPRPSTPFQPRDIQESDESELESGTQSESETESESVTEEDLSDGSPEEEESPKGELCALCNELEDTERLWKMCACTETRAHKTCVEVWLESTNMTVCTHCGYHYVMHSTSKYMLGAAVWTWLCKHAKPSQVLLMAFLVALMTAEAALMDLYVLRVTQSVQVNPVDGEPRDYYTNFLQYWRFVVDAWSQFLHGLTLQPAFMVLAVTVFAAQLAYLVPLIVDNVTIFYNWYCTTFILLLGEEPGAATHTQSLASA